MHIKAKHVIGFLVVWNIILTLYIVKIFENSAETENKVRNIYNRATNITYEELTEPGTVWEYYDRLEK